MQRDIFRKTTAGHAEIRARALGFDARTRGLLILVNGELTVGELATRVGFDPVELLMRFVGAGLVEKVANAAPKLRPAPAPVAAQPAQPPVPATAVVRAEFVPADVAAAWRRAVIELAPHYGPDAEVVTEPLRSAATPEQFAVALAELRDKLSVFLGRKGAEQMAQRIAQGR
ncbi:MAG: hypothetical protein QM722_24745 [Piscinibacter sp.]